MPFFYKMGVFAVFQWKIVFTIDDYRATAFVLKPILANRKKKVFNVAD